MAWVDDFETVMAYMGLDAAAIEECKAEVREHREWARAYYPQAAAEIRAASGTQLQLAREAKATRRVPVALERPAGPVVFDYASRKLGMVCSIEIPEQAIDQLGCVPIMGLKMPADMLHGATVTR